MNNNNIFFHVDIDAFFASIEKIDNPHLKNKPVIVGGLGNRGVVSTCSYEARELGIHSAMPILQAYELCPHGVFIQSRINRYHEKSSEIMNILKNYTPDFHQISIDEAFLNITGMEKLLGSPIEIARNLKETVYKKTGIIISIGIASSKYIAKIASDISKPNGLLFIRKEKEFIHSLPLKKIWGIGEKTITRLEESGLNSIKGIQKINIKNLENIVGKANSQFIFNIINLNTEHIFNDNSKNHSLSTERTFKFDINDISKINDLIFEMSSEIMYRMLEENINSNTIGIKIRYNNFKTVNIQKSGDKINDTSDLYHRAKELFKNKYDQYSPIRLLGLSILKTSKKEHKSEFFENTYLKKKRIIEKTAIAISGKNGKDIIKRARLIK